MRGSAAPASGWPDGRAVEHLPEPQQRLAHGELLRVHVGKVLGLKSHVFRVQRKADDVAGQLGGQLQIELAAVRAAQVELVKLVAHNLGAALRGVVAGELLIEKLNPAAVDLFRLGRGTRDVVCNVLHTNCTIQHWGGMRRMGARFLQGPAAGLTHSRTFCVWSILLRR
jgi:hypothetical protein